MTMTIDKLKSMSDDELRSALGYDAKLETFKSSIADADALKGKARTDVEQRVAEMFLPHVYPDDLKYTIESAKRRAAKGTEVLADACPCSCCD